MRRIKIQSWKEKDEKGNVLDANTLSALSYCLNVGLSSERIAGWDKARMVNALDRAFIKAKETGILELEEAQYAFLKKLVEKHMPAIWGGSKDILGAITEFIDAKEVK